MPFFQLCRSPIRPIVSDWHDLDSLAEIKPISCDVKDLQSRPIKMRTPILYLANRWTKFKMLLTSNRFLYLIRFLLLSFPLIPQFIAQFRSICLFLCSSPYFLPVATKWELEQSMHCPLCHCCHSFLFSPSERTKWRSKKVLKSLS